MIRIWQLTLSLCVFAFVGVCGHAQETNAKDIVRKAIAAYGGEKALGKYQAGTQKYKGTITLGNQRYDMTAEVAFMRPDKCRVAETYHAGGQSFDNELLFNGRSLWATNDGHTVEIKDEHMIDEVRRSLLFEGGGLLELIKEPYHLKSLGDINVKGTETIAIRASKKGDRDITIYFDKKTHLIWKFDTSALDVTYAKETTAETYLLEHQDVDGLKVKKRVVVIAGGVLHKEFDVLDVRVLEKLDEKQFTRPPLPPLPTTPAFASMTKDGRIALRISAQWSKYVLNTRPDGKPEYVQRSKFGEQTVTYNVHDFVKAFDATGKAVDVKSLPDLLKKETPIVYGYLFDANPPNVRFFKDGVLILYLPPPAPVEVPTATAKPANVPVAGLAELLKEKGYVAIPLERMSSGHLIVRVRIGGKAFTLMVDTGAANSPLDQYRTRSLGLEWDDDPKCEIAGITIGDVKTGKLVVYHHDMTSMNRAAKFANDPLVDGLLGADVLHPHAAVIDQAGAILYLKKLPEKEE